jgi:hypothetical protein
MHNCPKINIFNSHRKKILEEKCLFIFLLQYLFISILCGKILCELGLISTIEVTGIKSIKKLCKSNVVFSLCKNFKENLNIEPTKKARRTPALPRQ